MYRDTKVKLGLVAGAVLIVGLVAYINAGSASTVADSPVALYRKGQAAFQKLDIVWLDRATKSSLSTITTATELDHISSVELMIGSMLVQAEVSLDSIFLDRSPSAEAVRELVNEAASFYAVALFQDDPAAYLKWMQDRGYRLKTDADWMFWGGLRAAHTGFTGLAAAESLTAEESFEAAWRVSRSEARFASGRVVGLSNSAAGMHIALGHSTLDRKFTGKVESETGLSFEEWHGSHVSSCPMWVTAVRTRESLLETHRVLDAAAVAIVAQNEDGSRHPISTWWFRDPTDGRWRVFAFLINNHSLSSEYPCVSY